MYVKLFDRDGDPIDDTDLAKLLLQYKCDSSFYIEINVEGGVQTPLASEVLFFFSFEFKME